MFNRIKKYLKNKDGNIASTMGILALPLMMGCGVAIDYASLYHARVNLQDAADTAALASAKELGLVNTKDETVKEVAKNYVNSSLIQTIGKKGGLHTADVLTSI
jgi:Flp pilus assembly protein TadG